MHDWDPWNLPLRTDESCRQAVGYIQAGGTLAEQKCQSMTQGINGESILTHLPSFSQTQSCPHDAMHLIWENLVPRMVELWTHTGRFKTLDPGTETYEIDPLAWEQIGEESAIANATIPSIFCRALPNIAKERHLFTAEAWAFWIVYIAPYSLRGRLADKYYNHLMLFVDIIKLCLQFVITNEEILALQEMIIRWVEHYEQ